MQPYLRPVLLTACLLFSQYLSAIIAITSVTHDDSDAPPHCFGAISLTAEGNAGPFTFLWSNGATTKNIFGLCEDTYTVTVTNSFGCTVVLSATIYNCFEYPTSPPLQITNAAITSLSAPGASDGAINLTVTGGLGGKRYFKWTKQGSNTVIAATEDINNLPAGTYCVEISGDCSGPITACYTIAHCGSLQWTVTPTIKNNCNCSTCEFCNGSCPKGSISLAITSPSGLKSYQWSNGGTGSSISNLNAGTYTVTITDKNTGCTKSQSFTVSTSDVVVTKVSGCAWKATCDGNQIDFHVGEQEQKISIEMYQGQQRCMKRQYCDGVPVEGAFTVLGAPEKRVDEDFCKGELVCKDGIFEEVMQVILGIEEILESGDNCQDKVKCSITWPDGTKYENIEYTNNYDYCVQWGSNTENTCKLGRYCENINFWTAIPGTWGDTPGEDPNWCTTLPTCPQVIIEPAPDRSAAEFKSRAGRKIAVFPNPFSEYLDIQYGGFITQEPISVKIFDATGKEVYTSALLTGTGNGILRLTPEHKLYTGMYRIQILDSNSVLLYDANLVHSR